MAQGSASFTRRARLTRAVEYQRVFAQAERSSSRSLTVLARANGLAQARLGLAISRKVAARAVQRNRIKRTVRESFRYHQALLKGWDIVVLARPPAAASEAATLRAELQQHWNRLKQRPCAPCSS